MSLRALFDKYGSDKGSRHGYERVYDTLSPPERMLEVGVFRGASLRAWVERWPDAEIVGVDDAARGEKLRVYNAYVITGSSLDPHVSDAVWCAVGCVPVDIIIDDGDHSFRAQAATLRNLWPLLAPGGRYFIEDVFPWDLMDPDEKRHPWLLEHPGSWNDEGWQALVDALLWTGGEVARHDLREGHQVDSYIIEVRKSCAPTV